jgi:hypothetical protein
MMNGFDKMNDVVYFTVRVEILPDSNTQEIVSECDYSFSHPQIVETEIVDMTECIDP